MEIHKPKAVHGWRGLASEVGIIVLGVLIALGAEQGVEILHWRHKTAEAEDAMRLELREDDLPQAFTRVAVSACVEGQLAAVEQAIEEGRPRPEIAALARAVLPPIRTWDMEAWRVALASDVAGHMASDRIIGWSDPYRVIPALDQVNRRETELLGDLQAGGQRPGALSETERERVLVAVQQLRNSNRMMTVGSRVLMATAARRGILMPAAEKPKALSQLRAAYGGCLQTPPPESGLRLGNAAGSLGSRDDTLTAR